MTPRMKVGDHVGHLSFGHSICYSICYRIRSSIVTHSHQPVDGFVLKWDAPKFDGYIYICIYIYNIISIFPLYIAMNDGGYTHFQTDPDEGKLNT